MDAFKLAESLLALDLPRRWQHVQGVERRARTLSEMFDPEDVEMLSAAALLHDIGYAPGLTSTGFHALDGARYLRALDFPVRLCALVAYHSCAYREARLRELSVELSDWEDEESPLRDALWWADMTTTPDGNPTDAHDRIAEIEKRYGAGHLITTFIRQAKPDLVAAVERTEERLRAAGLGHLAK